MLKARWWLRTYDGNSRITHDHFRHAIKWYASLDQRLLQWSDMLPLPGGSAQDRRSHQVAVGVTAADRRMRFQRIRQIVF